MNLSASTQNQYNEYSNSTVITRSGHATVLDSSIEIVRSINNSIHSLKSKTNEINNIVNTKNISSNDKSSIKSVNTLKNKNLEITNMLIPNLNTNNQVAPTDLCLKKTIKNNAKYFSIGNKNMNLNVFKNLINNFNLSVSQIENNSYYGKNTLRYYLNLLTQFEYKLANSTYNYYKFNKTNNYLFAMKKAARFLKSSFNSKGCVISKPSFNLIHTNNTIENEITNNKAINNAKVIIHLFYYERLSEIDYSYFSIEDEAKVLTEKFGYKFENLTDYLTKLFNAEIELNLVKLYQPYQDSNILVQFINTESYNNKFIKIVSRLFKNINMNNYKSDLILDSNIMNNKSNNYISYPSAVSGVNIKLAGRPLNERIIPRLTVKRAQRGSFNRLNAKLIEKSMFTDKTRKGAFSFTVNLSHKF